MNLEVILKECKRLELAPQETLSAVFSNSYKKRISNIKKIEEAIAYLTTFSIAFMILWYGDMIE